MGRCGDARDRLLEATIELIWQQSYGAVTVDSICAKAEVKKGSFYYFFESKDELVGAALEAHWKSIQPDLDRLFSPSIPPLERLRGYFDFVYQRQVALRGQFGRTLGCPYVSLGCEMNRGSQSAICDIVKGIFNRYYKYFESALRDAQAEGLIAHKDVGELAKALFAFKDGILAQARIQDDPEIIRTLWSGSCRLLGVEVREEARAQ
jgi:TetR/AcrR family transcriptional repressor of nem operon